MEETAYLARLFMSLTHCSVNKNEATGLVANPGAIRSRCETSFPAGAPQRCRGKSTGLTLNVVAPDGRLTDGLKVGAGARKVSLLLGLAERSMRLSIDKSRPKGLQSINKPQDFISQPIANSNHKNMQPNRSISLTHFDTVGMLRQLNKSIRSK